MPENELLPFTFTNGITILTRSVSVMSTLELHREFQPPPIPKQKVQMADEQEVWEENPADPDYLADLAKYQVEQEDRIQRLIVKRGAVVNWTDELRAQVKDMRDFWKLEYKKELPGDDLMVYVMHICIGPQEDLQKLVNKILRQSQPTPEAIAEAQDSFPSQV